MPVRLRQLTNNEDGRYYLHVSVPKGKADNLIFEFRVVDRRVWLVEPEDHHEDESVIHNIPPSFTLNLDPDIDGNCVLIDHDVELRAFEVGGEYGKWKVRRL